MRLTERDKQVVKAVNDFRIMRQDQVQRLFFPSRNTAQVRLWLLWAHGYLKRAFLPVIGGIQNSPILYLVDKRGVGLLRYEYGYEATSLRWSRGKTSYRFLEHTLGLTEVGISMYLSSDMHGARLTTWLDEKAMKADYDRVQVRNRLVSVLPDAYFVVELPAGKMHFFLEYDRGDESLKVFKAKLAAYWAYFQSGKCQARYGTSRIRVLTVTEGRQTRSGRSRVTNLKGLTSALPGRQWFWFSTLERVAGADFLAEPIWWSGKGEEPMALIQ